MEVSHGNEREVFLTIVIPAYNEERKIIDDLNIVYDYFEKQNYVFEVIVVDDGSADNTYKVLCLNKSDFDNLKVISYEKNKGKGYAVKVGVLEAKSKFILFADAGTCVPYEDSEKGLNLLLQDSCEIAIGSRAHGDARILLEQPRYRRMGSMAFGVIARWLMNVNPIKDTQCGFKLFKYKVAQDLFSKQKTDGFMFDIEMILNAKKQNYRIEEFPVEWSNDPDTRFNPISGSFRNMLELFKIRCRL